MNEHDAGKGDDRRPEDGEAYRRGWEGVDWGRKPEPNRSQTGCR